MPRCATRSWPRASAPSLLRRSLRAVGRRTGLRKADATPPSREELVAELAAIGDVFPGKLPLISSTKGLTGHAIGAWVAGLGIPVVVALSL